MWLQIWVLVMVVVNLSAIAFVVSRQTGKARLRIEALAILASFVAAGASVLPM